LTIDTALNFAWLGIGVLSVLFVAILEHRRYQASTRYARRRRLFAVLVMTVALFPAVSSSDDLFSFSWLNSHLGKHSSFGSTLPEDSKEKEKAGTQLFRMLETLNHYQVSNPYTPSLTLWCLGLVLLFGRHVFTRTVLCRCGRAPPLA